MIPKDEQQEFDEAVAKCPLKLAPADEFSKVLNQSYDPIENALRRFPGGSAFLSLSLFVFDLFV